MNSISNYWKKITQKDYLMSLDAAKSEKQQSRLIYSLVLLLVVIIEGFVFFCAFIYADSASALGYVSFAGTLVSIILAILAIIYTLAESVRQSSSSDKLYEGAAKINLAVESLSKNLTDLDNVKQEILTTKQVILDASTHGANLIDKAVARFEDKSSRFDAIQADLDEIKREKLYLTQPAAKDLTSNGTFNKYYEDKEFVKYEISALAEGSFATVIPFMLSVLCALQGVSYLKFIIDKSIDKYTEKLDDDTLWSRSGVRTGVAIVSSTLRTIKAIDYSKDSANVIPEYKDFLLNCCKKMVDDFPREDVMKNIIAVIESIQLELEQYR